MTPSTFVQESRLGRSIFQIRDGTLYISVSRFGGGFDEYQVDLQRLDPNYESRTTRLNFQLGLMGLLLVLSCLAIWGMHRQQIIPREALSYFSHWPYAGIGVSLIQAVRYSSRVEYFQFNNHWGKPVFAIVREKPQAAECEAFLLTLISHIELVRSNLPAGERNALLQQLARENAPVSLPGRDVAFWKLSLVLGFLAAGIPWVPGLAYYLDVFSFMLVFFLCAGGAACCAFSYDRKEPRRHWSLLGLVLSLLPPFFY